METSEVSLDKIRGTLLGTAVGDALGMPVEGLSHQNVRTYYKGIKEYRGDEERRDLEAGQWTDDTQFTFALVRALAAAEGPEQFPDQAAREYVELLPRARRWGPSSRSAVERLAEGASWREAGSAAQPTNGAAMRAAALGAWWGLAGVDRREALAVVRPVLEVTHRHPAALTAGCAQAFAVQHVLQHHPGAFEPALFWDELIEATAWLEDELGDGERQNSTRLRALTDYLDAFPLDLQDACNGTGGYASESWPFAAAMFVRNPGLVEATLLSTINVGGDADTTGAMTGALLGALHGWAAFPEAWRKGLEAVGELSAQVDAFYEILASRGAPPS